MSIFNHINDIKHISKYKSSYAKHADVLKYLCTSFECRKYYENISNTNDTNNNNCLINLVYNLKNSNKNYYNDNLDISIDDIIDIINGLSISPNIKSINNNIIFSNELNIYDCVKKLINMIKQVFDITIIEHKQHKFNLWHNDVLVYGLIYDKKDYGYILLDLQVNNKQNKTQLNNVKLIHDTNVSVLIGNYHDNISVRDMMNIFKQLGNAIYFNMNTSYTNVLKCEELFYEYLYEHIFIEYQNNNKDLYLELNAYCTNKLKYYNIIALLECYAFNTIKNNNVEKYMKKLTKKYIELNNVIINDYTTTKIPEGVINAIINNTGNNHSHAVSYILSYNSISCLIQNKHQFVKNIIMMNGTSIKNVLKSIIGSEDTENNSNKYINYYTEN